MKSYIRILAAFALVLSSCSKEEEVITPQAPNKYTLTITAEAGGTVSSPGGTYNEGSKITITATPDAQYLFEKWSDGSTVNPREITVTGNLTLSATFVKKTYPLSVTVEGEGTVQEEVIIQGSTSQTEHKAGTTVRLTATPKEGWKFESWSGDIESTNNPVTVTIESAKEVTANFKSLPILPIFYIQSQVFPQGVDINWNDHRKNSDHIYYFNQDNIPDIITSSRPSGTGYSTKITPSLVVYDYSGDKLLDFNIKDDFNSSIRDSLNQLNYDVGDFNLDGKLDFALQYMGEYQFPEKFYYSGVNVYLMISNNEGYEVTEIIDDPENIQFGIKMFDVDFDGDLDVVNDMNNGEVYLNNGNQIFERTIIEPLYISEFFHKIDWDGDGFEDVVNIGVHNKMITVLSAQGIIKIPFDNTGWDFYFTVEGSSEEWSVERSTLIDGDNDGDWDIVFGGFYDLNGKRYHEHKYFENQGGSFKYKEGFIEHNYSIREENNKFRYNNMLKVWAADLDEDGDTDLYYPTYGEFGDESSVFWWENTSEGFKMNFDFKIPNWANQ